MSAFRALVAQADHTLRLERWTSERLLPGTLTVRVAYSTVNFKDGLVIRPGNRVARRYPLVPGVDLAGTVEASDDARFVVGQAVIVHGWDLGTAHHGGYADLARVPAEWAVGLPDGLSARQAMALGTAGFTAALSIERIEQFGARAGDGPVLVTGASGGVGSTAVAMLAARGYEVVASTGSAASAEFLRGLGAARIVDRAETSAPPEKPLEGQQWAAAIDPVGGATLAYLLRTMRYGGSVALSGLTGGAEFQATVYPFILRGVNLLGIDAVRLPRAAREAVWQRLATDLRPPGLEESIAREVELEEVPGVLEQILRGEVEGRVVVRVNP